VVEVQPTGAAAKVIYQVDGIAIEREALTRADADAILQFLKTIAGLNLEEKRKPQNGRIWAQIGEHKFEVRVRTDGSTAGEKLTLRVISAEAILKVPELGFTPRQLEQIKSIQEAPQGVVVLSGVPGSGLSTTLYGFARSHDAFLMNIQTVETSRDIELDNITQNIFTPGGEKTLASETTRAVRSDPDILLVPDVRDRETAGILAKAGANRQKVYVSIQAVDVFDALRKWLITLVGDKQLAAASLLAVTNQRLVRALCTTCKQAYKPDAAMLRKLNMPADKVLHRPPEPTFDKHGNPIICPACQGSGYVGRTAVFDVLLVDNALRDVIRKAATFAEIQTFAMKRGGLGLQQNALHKVLEGVTSIQEVIRATRAPDPAPTAKPAPASG
jgi:type II secretory ATPase GspE/PulE/Tfp pilus assembly ATPase PilB-like protein